MNGGGDHKSRGSSDAVIRQLKAQRQTVAPSGSSCKEQICISHLDICVKDRPPLPDAHNASSTSPLNFHFAALTAPPQLSPASPAAGDHGWKSVGLGVGSPALSNAPLVDTSLPHAFPIPRKGQTQPSSGKADCCLPLPRGSLVTSPHHHPYG